MVNWDRILRELRERAKREAERNRPTPVVPPVETGKVMHVSVLDESGKPIQGSLISGAIGRPTWSVDGVAISWFMLEFVAPVGVNYGDPVSVLIRATGHDDIALEVPLAADLSVSVEPARAPARRGAPQASGYSIVDADGAFFPLGVSLFWLLGALKRGDDGRVWSHLEFVQQYLVDYVRILCHVKGGPWAFYDAEIDFRWPEFPSLLARLLDTGYDKFGVRFQLTAMGGAPDDVAALARTIEAVVASRRHTVIFQESTNEGNSTTAQAISVAKIFEPIGLPYGVGLGDQGIASIEAASDASGSNVAFFHPERGGDAVRQVRQCWDFKEFHRLRVNNEPPGPKSSVGEMEDPFWLALMRYADIVCGAVAFCFHTGHGVFGTSYPYGSGRRYGNLYDAPNVQAQLTAVRNADHHLKPFAGSIAGWTKFNTGRHVGWPIGDGKVDKLYGSTDGRHFALVASGATGPLVLPVLDSCTVKVFNPATKDVLLERHVNAGETLAISGLPGYGIVGEVG